MANFFTPSSIDVDKLNDYMETDSGTEHQIQLLKSMSKDELCIADMTIRFAKTLLIAESAGIRIGFGARFDIINGTFKNKINLEIDPKAILIYGNDIYVRARELLDIVRQYIEFINGYGAYLLGSTDAFYIASTHGKKFNNTIDVSLLRRIGK